METMVGITADYRLPAGECCPDLTQNIVEKIIFDREELRHRLFLQVILAKNVPSGVPVMYWEDLAIMVRIMIAGEDNELRSALVTEDVLTAIHMNQTDLFSEALENAVKIAPFYIRGLQEMLAIFATEISEMDGDRLFQKETAEPTLYVASCNQGIYGAACMFYPGFTEKAEEVCGGGFYILPASIHELMIVSDRVAITCEELKKMVQEINQTTLEEQEVLGDSIYHYNPADGIICKCC